MYRSGFGAASCCDDSTSLRLAFGAAVAGSNDRFSSATADGCDNGVTPAVGGGGCEPRQRGLSAGDSSSNGEPSRARDQPSR